MSNFLILVPARSGSKGVKNKNIRFVGGKPLIQWSLETAMQIKNDQDTVVLSSDSNEILDLAPESILKVKRPKIYSADTTPMIDVYKHIESSLNNWHELTGVILLQPTCPNRNIDQIREAINIFTSEGYSSLISVCNEEDFHPARMYSIEQNRMFSFMPTLQGRRRQELSNCYHRNGSLYITKRELVENNKIWDQDSFPYIMDREYSINIDDEFDLRMADLYMSKHCV